MGNKDKILYILLKIDKKYGRIEITDIIRSKSKKQCEEKICLILQETQKLGKE